MTQGQQTTSTAAYTLVITYFSDSPDNQLRNAACKQVFFLHEKSPLDKLQAACASEISHRANKSMQATATWKQQPRNFNSRSDKHITMAFASQTFSRSLPTAVSIGAWHQC